MNITKNSIYLYSAIIGSTIILIIFFIIIKKIINSEKKVKYEDIENIYLKKIDEISQDISHLNKYYSYKKLKILVVTFIKDKYDITIKNKLTEKQIQTLKIKNCTPKTITLTNKCLNDLELFNNNSKEIKINDIVNEFKKLIGFGS